MTLFKTTMATKQWMIKPSFTSTNTDNNLKINTEKS